MINCARGKTKLYPPNVWKHYKLLSREKPSKECCAVRQSCPTLCDPLDCSPPGSSVRGDSPGRNNEVGGHVFLQGIFPTQGSNLGLPPDSLLSGSLSRLQGIFLTKELNRGLLHCRWTLYQLSYQGSPKERVLNQKI